MYKNLNLEAMNKSYPDKEFYDNERRSVTESLKARGFSGKELEKELDKILANNERRRSGLICNAIK